MNLLDKRNALGKTNKETIELPLLITKAKTSSSIGLDWMQRLKHNLSSNNEAIQIHNIQLDNTDKKIIKLQHDFKDLFYNNEEIKKSLNQSTAKRRGTNNATKRKTNSDTLTRPSGTRVEATYQTRILRKSNGNHRRLLCEPLSDYSEKRQINKNCSRFQKTQRSYNEKKNQDAKYGRANFTNIKKDIRRKRRRILAPKLDFDYAYGQIKLHENTKTFVYSP